MIRYLRSFRYLKSKYLYQWILATILGALVANVIAIAFYRTFTISWGLSSWGLGLLTISTLVLGAANSLFQWHILKGHFKKAYWWIAATAIGEVLAVLMGHAVGFYTGIFVPDDFQILFWVASTSIILINSLLPGVSQWFFFDGRVQYAWSWIIFSLVAEWWVPRLFAGGILNGIVSPASSTVEALVEIVLWGAILGFMTGIPLVNFILQRGQRSAAELP